MKQVACITFLLLLSVWMGTPVCAQDPIVYPAEGQSQDQMEKDKFQCYTWARDQTGFDPMKTPTTQTAPPAKEKKVWGAGKTAVAGGAGGAIVGGVAGGGRRGIVTGGLIGATGGALIGSARSSDQRDREEKKRQDWERKEANNYARARNEYNRAFGACMEGRGYSVK